MLIGLWEYLVQVAQCHMLLGLTALKLAPDWLRIPSAMLLVHLA